MSSPTLAQAARELDRYKLFLDTTDERYSAISVECPQVTVNKGIAALNASMFDLSGFEVPPELTELPQEGLERSDKARDAIRQVEAQVALIRSCCDHIKNGTPLSDTSGLSMSARLVRTGYLNGESVEANALVKYLEENLAIAENKVEVLKTKKFRLSNAVEASHLNNRLKYLTALLQLSRQCPTSVLDHGVLEAAIKLGNKELQELHARLKSYYSKKGE